MEAKKEVIDVRGHQLHVAQAGQGEVLLYLHGAGDVARWSPALDKLSDKYRVIAPQHPGFGDSLRLDWIETVDDMVFFYTDLLDTLQLDKVHLAGSSIGGWIAAEFATRHPERLLSLTLIDAVGIRVKGRPYADIFGLNAQTLRKLAFYNPEAVPVPTPEEQQKMIRDRRMLAQLAWEPRLFNPKLEERLFRISLPALVVWGKQDGLAPLAVGEKYASLIPGATLTVLDECGHSPMLEQPIRLAETIENFLGKQVKGA